MAETIAFVIANYFLTLPLVGLLAAGIALWRKPRPLPPGAVVEALLSYFILFGIGASYIFNFVMHVFFADMASRFIGWERSPFETEVGFASLGFGVVALLAFRGGYGARVGAVVGPAIFMLGAAGGHLYQMIVAHNFAPGNAGVVFYTDIAVPLFGLALLLLQRRHAPAVAAG